MLVLAGITSLMSIFGFFYLEIVSSTIGFLLGLILVFVSAFLIGTARPVWSAQIGERQGILRDDSDGPPLPPDPDLSVLWAIRRALHNAAKDQLPCSLFILNFVSLIFELIAALLRLLEERLFCAVKGGDRILHETPQGDRREDRCPIARTVKTWSRPTGIRARAAGPCCRSSA